MAFPKTRIWTFTYIERRQQRKLQYHFDNWRPGDQKVFVSDIWRCLAPDFLDTELSVFMQRLQVQEAAGEPGRA